MGLRGGILATVMPSLAKTASKAAVNFASRSRERSVKSVVWLPSCHSGWRVCRVAQVAVG